MSNTVSIHGATDIKSVLAAKHTGRPHTYLTPTKGSKIRVDAHHVDGPTFNRLAAAGNGTVRTFAASADHEAFRSATINLTDAVEVTLFTSDMED